MAPAVPFALLGVVQLTAVVTWLGIAAAACFPRLRRRGTPLLVLGAAVLATVEALTVLRFGAPASEALGWARAGGLVLVAAGLADRALLVRTGTLPVIVVPLGSRPIPSLTGAGAAVLGAVLAASRSRGSGRPDESPDRQVGAALAAGLVLTAAAAAASARAGDHTWAALAVLAARGAASIAFVAALVLLARTNLLGKVVGSIVAGVVVMAVGAVGVVGSGVAGQVQRDQSGRLTSVAQAQQQALTALGSRAGLFARVVAQCPADRAQCVRFLDLFAVDPAYFAVLDQPGSGVQTVAPHRRTLDPAALVQLAGSPVVRQALGRSATSTTVATGAVLLHGAQSRLAVVAAVPGRPGGSTDARIRPTFAAVYGIVLSDAYLRTLRAQTGYDVSVVAGGRLLSSSLGSSRARGEIAAEARSGRVDDAPPTATRVVPARGDAPTVAFVPVTAAGDDGVRIATLAVSQPASIALAAQRSVLRRLVLTALLVLALVAALAFLLAQRIAEPVRRLTAAAGRVRGGDLTVAPSVGSRDEVGALATTFGEMTASLRGLTDDLRASAEQETALRSRLETVLGSMTDALLATDGADLVMTANATALELLAAGSDAVLGRPLAEVLDVRAADGTGLLDVGADGGADRRTSADGLLHRADGSTVAVRVAAAPLGSQPGRVVVVADRTRDREVERMKTEFLSNVSHELRTPMTPIRGYAELLVRKRDLTREQRDTFVGEILTSTHRMNRAVELLVDVAALEAGRVVPQRRPVAVAGFVDRRLADWRTRWPDRGADLRRRVAPRLPAVDVDPVWLAKALDELADNAVKYSSPGSPVTLVASMTDEGLVRVGVRDAGTGFDASRQAELLGDFSQADGSETRRYGGLGLGLGFVDRVATVLGVALHVTSTPGRGSEFALDVPKAVEH